MMDGNEEGCRRESVGLGSSRGYTWEKQWRAGGVGSGPRNTRTCLLWRQAIGTRLVGVV